MATDYWNLWIAGVGSAGLEFARGRLTPTETLLVHAAPEKLTVEVLDGSRMIAHGENLARTSDTPIARLRREGERITREDIWPTEVDYGTPVILAGGEVGRLTAWWHAPSHTARQWSIELYNHR